MECGGNTAWELEKIPSPRQQKNRLGRWKRVWQRMGAAFMEGTPRACATTNRTCVREAARTKTVLSDTEKTHASLMPADQPWATSAWSMACFKAASTSPGAHGLFKTVKSKASTNAVL